jgi:hypothetical protein
VGIHRNNINYNVNSYFNMIPTYYNIDTALLSDFEKDRFLTIIQELESLGCSVTPEPPNYESTLFSDEHNKYENI